MWRCKHILPAVCLCFLLACSKESEKTEFGLGEGNKYPVQLALRVGAGELAVKGNTSVITEMDETFRGMTEITLLPFKTRESITAEDIAAGHPSTLPDITAGFYPKAVDGGEYVPGLILNNQAHLYPGSVISLPDKTASVLIYGRAPTAPQSDELEEKHVNGALTATGFEKAEEMRSAGDIRFTPVPIYGNGLPSEAGEMAAILNAIVPGASYTVPCHYLVNGVWHSASASVAWNENTPDTRLREFFLWITNGGKLITGSGVNVEYMLSYLYRLLKEYNSYDNSVHEYIYGDNAYETVKTAGGTDKLTSADLYNGLRDLLIARIEALDGTSLRISGGGSINFTSPAMHAYPGNRGLPDGAAVLRWTGAGYEAVEEMLDGVAPLSSFCFPPCLWYFANTTLSTSSSDRDDIYTSSRYHWSDLLSEYRSGKVVYSDTQAVALDDPLQYSCGVLIATVRASAERLETAGLSGQTVDAGGTNFPVTGVIIGGQRSMRFDFTPQRGGTDYFLYDKCISGVYLRNAADKESAPSFKTLVSQTLDGEEIYFCLELRNDSGAAFSGADGNILPGSKFYLVGNIPLPEDDSYARIFQKDHATTINCLITSLAEARNAIPDLEHPNLSMGLQVSVNWIQSTSSYIVMY